MSGTLKKEEHVKNWKASNLSKRRYCLENGIKESTFHGWLKKSESNSSSSWESVELIEDSEEKTDGIFFEISIMSFFEFRLQLRLKNDTP